jgi:ankyrin repeat protein
MHTNVFSPLHNAARKGDVAEVVRLLIANSSNVNSQDKYVCPLIAKLFFTFHTYHNPHFKFCFNFAKLNLSISHLTNLFSMTGNGD